MACTHQADCRQGSRRNGCRLGSRYGCRYDSRQFEMADELNPKQAVNESELGDADDNRAAVAALCRCYGIPQWNWLS